MGGNYLSVIVLSLALLVTMVELPDMRAVGVQDDPQISPTRVSRLAGQMPARDESPVENRDSGAAPQDIGAGEYPATTPAPTKKGEDDGVAKGGSIDTSVGSDYVPSTRVADNHPDNTSVVGVRLTYYTDRGITAYGCPTVPSMAATDPQVIPPGTIFRIVGGDRLYYACDTGGMVQGPHVDAWVPTEEDGREMITRLVEEGWAWTEGNLVFGEVQIVQEVK